MTNTSLPSEVLMVRLLALRNAHGWTQSELADRMTTYGWSWDRTTVAKVEAGKRQLPVDEFISLAHVLGVAPAALVTPMRNSESVAVTPTSDMPAPNMWRWMTGTFPAGGRRHGEVVQVADRLADIRFYSEAVPDYVIAAENRLPGLQRLIQLLSGVQSLAGHDDDRATEHEVSNLDEALELLRSVRRRSQLQVKRESTS